MKRLFRNNKRPNPQLYSDDIESTSSSSSSSNSLDYDSSNTNHNSYFDPNLYSCSEDNLLQFHKNISLTSSSEKSESNLSEDLHLLNLENSSKTAKTTDSECTVPTKKTVLPSQNAISIKKSPSKLNLNKPLKNFTYTPRRLRDIERSNAFLMEKIMHTAPSTSIKRSKSNINLNKNQVHVPPSTTIRKKQQQRIEYENKILLKKLNKMVNRKCAK